MGKYFILYGGSDENSSGNIFYIVFFIVILLVVLLGIYFFLSKTLIKPYKIITINESGVNLSSYWVQEKYIGLYYLEADLDIPLQFTSNHVIFECGGNDYGLDLLIINEDEQYNLFFGFCNSSTNSESYVKVPINNIPKFLGNKGKLGFSIECIETNKWKVRLFWNNNLIAESKFFIMKKSALTDLDGYGYYLQLNTTLCNRYSNLIFTPFPNVEKQGELRLFKNYAFPPNK
jgi:hypothetical protein